MVLTLVQDSGYYQQTVISDTVEDLSEGIYDCDGLSLPGIHVGICRKSKIHIEKALNNKNNIDNKEVPLQGDLDNYGMEVEIKVLD